MGEKCQNIQTTLYNFENFLDLLFEYWIATLFIFNLILLSASKEK